MTSFADMINDECVAAMHAVRGITNLSEALLDYTYNIHCNQSCNSCKDLIREYIDHVYAGRNGADAYETCKKLTHPKFRGITSWYDDYLGDVSYDIMGCKRCMNEALLDFSSDLELEDSDRDHDYSRELKNQRLHYAHHGSHKNSKASKKNKPISRNKKYRDVTVV